MLQVRFLVGSSFFLLYTLFYRPGHITAESSFSIPIHFQINGSLTTQLLRLYPARTGSESMEEQVNQFCIQFHVIDQKCRDIYFFATSMYSRNSEEYRKVMNIPSTLVEANLSLEDVIMLRDFIGSISSFDCPSQEAKTSFQQWIQKSFTEEQFHLWHHIATSDNYRDLRALIPCNATAWTPHGRWYSFPVWAHNNDKHIGLIRCNDNPPDVSSLVCESKEQALIEKCDSSFNHWCDDFFPPVTASSSSSTTTPSSCLVYTIGVGNVWHFERFASQTLGCEVHAFDPSPGLVTQHTENVRYNMSSQVHFHPIGLRGRRTKSYTLETVWDGGGDTQLQVSTLYEMWTGLGHNGVADSTSVSEREGESREQQELMQQQSHLQPEPLQHDQQEQPQHQLSSPNTLTPQSLSPLPSQAHQRRGIDILRIDCEGCEWEALHQIVTETPQVLESVSIILLELHVSVSLQMVTSRDLHLIARFWQSYIYDLGFRLFFSHDFSGAFWDRNVHPVLIELGLTPNFCCYEIGLYRNISAWKASTT